MLGTTQQGYQGLVLKLIIANIVIFVLMSIGGPVIINIFIHYLALTPERVLHNYYIWQPVTYMFLHANFAHVFFNMYALLIFGMPIEHEWGSKRFLFYYFFTGIGAGLTIFIINLIIPGQGYITPTIGASGAVFGLLLAFGLLYPNAEILLFFFIPLKAKYLVVLYGSLELFLQFQGGAGNISHIGHLGGLFFGLVYFIVFRKHSITFRAKILQNRLKKKLTEHERGLNERKEAMLDKSVEYKVDILKKVEARGIDALSDDEIQYINYLKIMMEDTDKEICAETDFAEDDDYCRKCENFDACFIRRLERYQLTDFSAPATISRRKIPRSWP